MVARVIPIASSTKTIPLTGEVRYSGKHWIDQRGRPLRDVRISVTDRCNFRCQYCMPKDKFEKTHLFLAHTEVLSFEEIERLVKILVAHGVEKVRLTGGEPLLRKGIEHLVKKLTALITHNGKKLDVALTTNGSALSAKAQALAEAGLNRLTVSLDAIDPLIYKKLNDVNFPIEKTLDGLHRAKLLGFKSIKINVVVKKDTNEKELIKIAQHFRNTGIIVRFIEFMDVGTSNEWKMEDVIPSRQIVEMINLVYPLEPIDPNYKGEVAQRWQYKDGAGELGFISSVTEPFCCDCSRLRISVDGKVYKCLFASEGYDLRQMLRGGASDEEIAQAIGRIWSARDDHYSELRTSNSQQLRLQDKIEMSYIGG